MESEYLNQNNRLQLAIDYIDHEIKKRDLFTNAEEHKKILKLILVRNMRMFSMN